MGRRGAWQTSGRSDPLRETRTYGLRGSGWRRAARSGTAPPITNGRGGAARNRQTEDEAFVESSRMGCPRARRSARAGSHLRGGPRSPSTPTSRRLAASCSGHTHAAQRALELFFGGPPGAILVVGHKQPPTRRLRQDAVQRSVTPRTRVPVIPAAPKRRRSTN